jgi:hypothetical protein
MVSKWGYVEMTEIEYDNEKEFNETVDKLEPMPGMPMSSRDTANLTTNAIVSIAISLKRIADIICSPPPIVAEMTPEEIEKAHEEWLKMGSNIIFNKS